MFYAFIDLILHKKQQKQNTMDHYEPENQCWCYFTYIVQKFGLLIYCWNNFFDFADTINELHWFASQNFEM